MSQKALYITQQQHHPSNINNSHKLQMYIDSLQHKIEGAKWKQKLILTYNYMPLEFVKEKINQEKQVYVKKLDKLEAKLHIQTRNQQTQQQVQYFREFGDMLINRIKQIQQRMDTLKIQMTILKASVQEKKESLHYLLKQNAYLSKLIISEQNKIAFIQQPIKRKPQLQGTITSRVNNFPLKTLRALSQLQKNTPKSTKYSYQSASNWRKSDQLFEECVQATIKSLKNMNASEDVQAGIYLEIMNRKLPVKAPTFSLKSKACDVLMDRYKDLKVRKPKQNDDFEMSVNTFLGLNWKQIMGIILVKDRNATKLKQLLKICQQSQN